MHADKAVIEGNQFIGLFARSSDRLTIVPRSASQKFVEKCRSVLKTEVMSVSVSASNLVGIFSAMNSNGIVLSSIAYRDEAREIKEWGLGLNVAVLHGKLTAVGNIVLANDKAAVVNPSLGKADAKSIEDCLGVEVVKRRIAGYPTPGCAGVVTNKGLLLHGETSDEELHELEEIFGVKGGVGTANMGVPFIGLCMIANSHGYIVGEGTSGFEMAQIDEALGFI